MRTIQLPPTLKALNATAPRILWGNGPLCDGQLFHLSQTQEKVHEPTMRSTSRIEPLAPSYSCLDLPAQLSSSGKRLIPALAPSFRISLSRHWLYWREHEFDVDISGLLHFRPFMIDVCITKYRVQSNSWMRMAHGVFWLVYISNLRIYGCQYGKTVSTAKFNPYFEEPHNVPIHFKSSDQDLWWGPWIVFTHRLEVLERCHAGLFQLTSRSIL